MREGEAKDGCVKIRSTVGRLDVIPHYKQTRTSEDGKQGADMIHFRKILMAG